MNAVSPSPLKAAMANADAHEANTSQRLKDERLALAIASVDHIRRQTGATSWTSAHAASVDMIHDILDRTALVDGQPTRAPAPSFDPKAIEAPEDQRITAARAAMVGTTDVD